MRGMLTEEIKKTAKELLDIELSVTQLRLLPYLQYVMMNERAIAYHKINQQEHDIVDDWIDKEWLIDGPTCLMMSKQFWDAMNTILWIGYANAPVGSSS